MLQLKIKNFRAIRHAEIDLAGITVLAGENGCGKSTISKFLYHTLYTAHNYNEIEDVFYSNLRTRYFREGVNAALDLVFSLKGSVKEININPDSFFLKNDTSIVDYFEKISDLLSQINATKSDNEFVRLQVQRFSGAINAIVGEPVDSRIGGLAIHGFLEKIRSLDADHQRILQQRPLSRYYDRLRRILEDDFDHDSFDLQELGVSIFNRNSDRLGNPFDIKNVFYIDTPWAVDKVIGGKISENAAIRLSHRTNLVNALRTTDAFGSSESGVMDGVIGGRVGVKKDDSSWRFEFHRGDGSVFDLFHCATGVKAFSILQMMYHGGLLNENTLLILDEPEAHLHPQWIVEYARLIVLLHARNKVRFMISSHSTDMVAAIQAISEKEGLREKTNFYIAKTTDENKVIFDYSPLGFEIGPIFESFNKSMEGIARYGADIG